MPESSSDFTPANQTAFTECCRMEILMTKGEFPVGWSTFQDNLKQGKGFIHVFIADDTSCKALYDSISGGMPRVGKRPSGAYWQRRYPGLPEARFALYHAMHNHHHPSIFASGGLTMPSFDELPAVYVVIEGSPNGRYLFQATIDEALEFIQAQIA